MNIRFLKMHTCSAIAIISLMIAHGWMGTTSAQITKYDETLQSMANASPKQRYYRFFQLQKQDNQFANTYIHLADACERIAVSLDPLRQYDRINHWMGNAKVYYQVFPIYLNDNEVRKTEEYYARFGITPSEKRLNNPDVLTYVNKHATFCNHFQDSLKMVFNTLEQSKEHYNRALAIFTNLCSRYENLNEALLQTTPALLQSLDEMDKEFNQSTTLFTAYQQLIAKFPIGNYKQQYTLRPIETFRLDGLTASDFLSNQFTLWNYTDWTTRFREVYQTDIEPLRDEIVALHRMFDANRRQIAPRDTIDESTRLSRADDLFFFRLGKYDQNSLVRELFRYENALQELLLLAKSPLNQITDSTLAVYNRKMRYTYRLAMQTGKTQQRLNDLQQNITPERIRRFNDFFNSELNGEAGVKQYCSEQTAQLSQTFDQALLQLNRYLLSEETTRSLTPATGSKAGTLAMTIGGTNKAGSHETSQAAIHQGQVRYLSGQSNGGGKRTAFVARVGITGKVEWLKEYEMKNVADNRCPALTAFDEGCMALVTGSNGPQQTNQLVRLSNAGKEIYRQNLPVTATPEFITYDDINKLSLMAFNDATETITLCQADSMGNTLWQTPLPVTGKVVNVIKPDSMYVAFINFSKQQLTTATSTSSGLLAVTIDPSGKVIKATPLTSSSPLVFERVFPISGSEISLLGYRGTPSQRTPAYLVMKPNGEVVFKNFD